MYPYIIRSRCFKETPCCPPHPQQGFLQPIACWHHSPGTNTNGTPWEKLTLPWTKLTPPWTFFPTASISDGAADRENGVLRKKCHVVRKKTHVVRKIFYVASIFHGIRSLTNSPPHRATKGGVGVKGSGCGAQGSRLGVGCQKVHFKAPPTLFAILPRKPAAEGFIVAEQAEGAEEEGQWM